MSGNPLTNTPRRAIPRPVFAGLLALCALTLLVPAPARADDDLPPRIGRVAEMGGELFLAPEDAADQWVAIGVNYPVATGDNLWVGNEGRAEIDFGSGQLRLAGDTSVHLSRLDDRNLALFVAQGRVILRIRVLDPGEAARIDTPNAQIALSRPGLYRIEVTEDHQHTQIAVREGEVIIDTGAAVQQVLPGQSASLDGGAPQYAQLRNGVTTDGFDTWSASRDRRYERSRVNSPVSRQMVGAADLDEYGAWETASDYGAVWYPANVAEDWAPYRNGYWTDVTAWGPTWVDAAPWGYAPFHYGRWVHFRGRWGWCPGAYVARPVWAPALVGWIGGPGWRVTTDHGAPVYGWVPLGWGEAYHPRWKACSDGCWVRYNQPYAVNTTVRPSGPPARWANAGAPGAVTAVPGSTFAWRKPVAPNLVAISGNAVASAPVLAAPTIRPENPPGARYQARKRCAAACVGVQSDLDATAEARCAGRRGCRSRRRGGRAPRSTRRARSIGPCQFCTGHGAFGCQASTRILSANSERSHIPTASTAADPSEPSGKHEPGCGIACRGAEVPHSARASAGRRRTGDCAQRFRRPGRRFTAQACAYPGADARTADGADSARSSRIAATTVAGLAGGTSGSDRDGPPRGAGCAGGRGAGRTSRRGTKGRKVASAHGQGTRGRPGEIELPGAV